MIRKIISIFACIILQGCVGMSLTSIEPMTRTETYENSTLIVRHSDGFNEAKRKGCKYTNFEPTKTWLSNRKYISEKLDEHRVKITYKSFNPIIKGLIFDFFSLKIPIGFPLGFQNLDLYLYDGEVEKIVLESDKITKSTGIFCGLHDFYGGVYCGGWLMKKYPFRDNDDFEITKGPFLNALGNDFIVCKD